MWNLKAMKFGFWCSDNPGSTRVQRSWVGRSARTKCQFSNSEKELQVWRIRTRVSRVWLHENLNFDSWGIELHVQKASIPLLSLRGKKQQAGSFDKEEVNFLGFPLCIWMIQLITQSSSYLILFAERQNSLWGSRSHFAILLAAFLSFLPHDLCRCPT